MKAVLLTLALSTNFALAQATIGNGGKSAPDLSKLAGAPTAPRHAEIQIKHVLPNGSLVEGGWQDWEPGAKIPAGSPNRWLSFPNPVYIEGLAKGKVDGDWWDGMVEPAGTFTYLDTYGGRHTCHAFKLSNAADPVKALETKANAPGSWMFNRRGSALDQPAKR